MMHGEVFEGYLKLYSDVIKDIALRGFRDVDLVGDAKDQRFTMRYVIFVDNEVILWKYKKIPAIALSIMEAKCMATCHCMKEVTWFRQLSEYLGFVQEGAIFIMCGNQ